MRVVLERGGPIRSMIVVAAWPVGVDIVDIAQGGCSEAAGVCGTEEVHSEVAHEAEKASLSTV